MKKPLIIVIVLVILGAAVWYFGGSKTPATPPLPAIATESTVPVPVTETTKVSDKLSEFKNEELGFSVKYPSTWEKTDGTTDTIFAIPTGKADTNTVGKLEAKISVISGKCAFPPVTTGVKEKGTLKSGDLTFNSISLANTVQGRSYSDKMYSLQHDGICYILSYSAITLSPTTKGYKGSEATQMTNNNKAIVEAADQAFVSMVKSFAYVVGAVGQDETAVVPTTPSPTVTPKK